MYLCLYAFICIMYEFVSTLAHTYFLHTHTHTHTHTHKHTHTHTHTHTQVLFETMYELWRKEAPILEID